MSVTKRFVALCAVCVVICIMFAIFVPFLAVFFFIVLNTAVFSLLFADYFLSPSKNVFDIIRQNEEKLYFLTSNDINIFVRNNYHKQMEIMLRDELPLRHFSIENEDLSHVVEPSSGVVFSFSIMPRKRGSFLSPAVHIQYKGILGFCRKYARIDLPIDYKVYPNVKDVGKYRLIVQKDLMSQNGSHLSRIRGMGTDFESLRQYAPGDSYRFINWNATARARDIVINQYQIEKNQPVYILIDSGRPLSYSAEGFKKLDYSINAAIILSDIVNESGDLCGLLVFNRNVTSVIHPGKGEQHRNLIMETLYHIEDTKDAPNYDDAFLELNKRQKRRGIVFVFTNFETEDDAVDLMESVKIIARRHVPVIVLMRDESVIRMAKNTEQLKSAAYEKMAAEEYLQQREKMIRKINAQGVVCVESSTENFAITAVNRYLYVKNKIMT